MDQKLILKRVSYKFYHNFLDLEENNKILFTINQYETKISISMHKTSLARIEKFQNISKIWLNID